MGVLELELGEDASPQCVPQARKSFWKVLIRGENEVDRVTRVEIETRRESILGVSTDDFCGGGNCVWPAVVCQVEDQPLEILLGQRLSMNVKHVHGLPRARSKYPSAKVEGRS